MRLNDGRYECVHCGAVLDIPLVGEPKVMIHGASGEPNMRVLSLNGKEIHRCDVDADKCSMVADSI
jgi:hypothetical protein